MDLQAYLVNKFASWRPPPPIVEGRTKRDITLSWTTEPFDFLDGDLLFWVQKKEKMPPWVVVYSGGKTTKTIDNLAPRHPHKFRVKVILKATAVPTLADRALNRFGNEKNIYEHIEGHRDTETENNCTANNGNIETSEDNTILKQKEIINSDEATVNEKGVGDNYCESVKEESEFRIKVDEAGDECNEDNTQIRAQVKTTSKRWLESQWSEETSISTDTDGTSVICFCMAVRCGYLKQVQVMLEERPDLIEIVNSSNGFTPLATAVRKGDINTVKFLLTAGANVNQPSSSGQTPLHLAALGGQVMLVDLLLDNGADFQARDLNGLRVEHYAADAGSPEMLNHILQRGGDLTVKDNNGWTPLFRAVTQGASTELIELLVLSGSDVTTADYAGLGLPSAARLLHNRHGRERDSILRLIDSQYPHEQAVANFTRLTKKISSLHTIFKRRPFCTKPRSNTPLIATPTEEPSGQIRCSSAEDRPVCTNSRSGTPLGEDRPVCTNSRTGTPLEDRPFRTNSRSGTPLGEHRPVCTNSRTGTPLEDRPFRSNSRNGTPLGEDRPVCTNSRTGTPLEDRPFRTNSRSGTPLGEDRLVCTNSRSGTPLEDRPFCTNSRSGTPLEDRPFCTNSRSGTPLGEDRSFCTNSRSGTPLEDRPLCTNSRSGTPLEDRPFCANSRTGTPLVATLTEGLNQQAGTSASGEQSET